MGTTDSAGSEEKQTEPAAQTTTQAAGGSACKQAAATSEEEAEAFLMLATQVSARPTGTTGHISLGPKGCTKRAIPRSRSQGGFVVKSDGRDSGCSSLTG